MATKPLIVIVGPTASGKSAIGMDIAERFNGEIICADSRTIYKGMDIGTAKPSRSDRARIKHHMLDIIEPSETFTAAEFKRLAIEAMNDIYSRGKLPVMVGGTGLYVDGVIFDYAFLPPVPSEEREQLQQLSVDELQQKLREQGIPLPENSSNPRHLIRALETNGAVAVKGGLRKETLVIGIDKSKQELTQAFERRTVSMIADELEEEVGDLVGKYGWDAPGLNAVGYREWRQYDSEDEVAEVINRNTLQYAKRQRTWFKRNPHIIWVKNSAEAIREVDTFIQKLS